MGRSAHAWKLEFYAHVRNDLCLPGVDYNGDVLEISFDHKFWKIQTCICWRNHIQAVLPHNEDYVHVH